MRKRTISGGGGCRTGAREGLPQRRRKCMPREGTHIHGARIMRRIFEFILAHVTMPGTWGALHGSRVRRRASDGAHLARGRGRGRARARTHGLSANYVAFHVVYAGARKTSELQLFTSRAGGQDTEERERMRERSSTDGNERKRKGGESAYARETRGGEGDGEGGREKERLRGTFACLRRFRAVSGNKRRAAGGRRKKFRSRVLRECT